MITIIAQRYRDDTRGFDGRRIGGWRGFGWVLHRGGLAGGGGGAAEVAVGGGGAGGGAAGGGGAVGFSGGEVSRAVGWAPQTLRLWERERLVRPRRTDRGYRVYAEPDVRRLRQIKHLRKVEGLNFAAIRKQRGAAPENGKTNRVLSGEPAGAPGE